MNVNAPLRLLVVLPSWVGDAVMATPALRLLRGTLRGSTVGVLARPGIDALLSGTDLFDEAVVQAPSGMMTPKHAAAKLRSRRYDAALLLTNSFSTALAAQLAFIPRRVGYDRDGRGLLLTQRLRAPKRPDGRWAIVPACAYYHHAARSLLDPSTPPLLAPDLLAADRVDTGLPPGARLELATTGADADAADALLERAGPDRSRPLVVLNPGANDPAKRWPADRFSALADHLASRGCAVVVAGSPAEADLARSVSAGARSTPAPLPDLGLTLGSLKGVLARAALLVTNDTGPRHVAAALGTPVVALFGPTDPRWTSIPFDRERLVLADPGLPPDQSANDHPHRCAIDRIDPARVADACARLLDHQA